MGEGNAGRCPKILPPLCLCLPFPPPCVPLFFCFSLSSALSVALVSSVSVFLHSLRFPLSISLFRFPSLTFPLHPSLSLPISVPFSLLPSPSLPLHSSPSLPLRSSLSFPLHLSLPFSLSLLFQPPPPPPLPLLMQSGTEEQMSDCTWSPVELAQSPSPLPNVGVHCSPSCLSLAPQRPNDHLAESGTGVSFRVPPRPPPPKRDAPQPCCLF